MREIGILFRYFTIFAYTCLDDMMLFKKRLHRVYVVLAGPLINLTMIPLACLVWRASPTHTLLHVVASDILVFFNLGVILQFIPFLQFDGYYVLAQLLRMPDLRKDSARFWISRVLHAFNAKTKPMQISASCPRYLPFAYWTYGIVSALASAAGVAFVFSQYLHWTVKLVGWIPAVSALGALVVVIAARFFTKSLPELLKSYSRLEAAPSPVAATSR